LSDDERTSLPIAQIQTSLEATFVDVVDMSGDGRHVTIKVVSKAFEGKNPINRQRMVYKAIWEEMQTDKVHAVQGIVTQTPEEAQ
jgi:acid stress-induced BolA-like protein IbaG/YrbA